jgi:hypothetical protein
MASQTGGDNMRRIIEAPGQWGLMLSAEGEHNLRGIPDDRVVGLDNGVVTACNTEAKRRGLSGFADLPADDLVEVCRGWDPTLYAKIVERFGARADFIVLPDLIAGGTESLARSSEWIPWALARCDRALVPVQDGMAADNVRPILSDRIGIFVGGLTEFKESTVGPVWGPLAREVGCWLHVGRVNTARRIFICKDAGAHSFDGTSASIFGRATLRKLDGASRQRGLFDTCT